MNRVLENGKATLREKMAAGVSRHLKTIPYDRSAEFFGEGVEVYLGTLGGNQRDYHEQCKTEIEFTMRGKEPDVRGKPTLVGIRARFAAMALREKDNSQIYDWEDPNVVEDIGQWPQQILDDIYEKGLAFNGMTEEAEQVMEKNSPSGQTGKSGSTLPDTLE